MPLYEYRCISCKSVTRYMRPMAKRNEPAVCPECGAAARRIISRPQKIEPAQMSPNEVLHDPEVWR